MTKSKLSSGHTRRRSRGNAPPREVLHYVFDTGALIAVERGDDWALRFVDLAELGLAKITTPAVCLLEWWHGRTDAREVVLRAVGVDFMTLAIFQAAGIACASVKGATTIDAAVMATASLRGGMVVTRDVDDFARLAEHFPGVRIFGRGMD